MTHPTHRVEFQAAVHDGNDAVVGFRWHEVDTFTSLEAAQQAFDELEADAPFDVRIVPLDFSAVRHH